MKNWLDADHAQALLARLEKLAASNKPRWGTFSAHQAICHLAEPVRIALGEKQAAQLASPLARPGLAQFVTWIAPWPKSAPTVPEFLPGKGMTSPTEFERDLQTLVSLLHRFSVWPANHNYAPSPVFGRLSNRAWGRLMWRHMDHHLRQFGA
jgi:hypothetical protein